MQLNNIDYLIANIRRHNRDVAWGKPIFHQMIKDIAESLEELNNKCKSCPICALKDAAE